MTRPCATCQAPTEASYGLCDTCLEARTTAERAAQVLPPTISDPVAIDKVATILRAAERSKADRGAA